MVAVRSGVFRTLIGAYGTQLLGECEQNRQNLAINFYINLPPGVQVVVESTAGFGPQGGQYCLTFFLSISFFGVKVRQCRLRSDYDKSRQILPEFYSRGVKSRQNLPRFHSRGRFCLESKLFDF